jgi:formylglycine-generating enzyme required for sulfatase activity
MKPIYFLLFSLFFPLLGSKNTHNTTNAPRTGKDYAVFFYVTKYDDQQWTDLLETKIECEKIAKELQENFGFEKPEMVTNPTKDEMSAKIREYNGRTYQKDDQVLFFFSMHGKYNGGESNDGIGYLIGRDGKAKDKYGDSYYSYDDLRTDLSLNQCKHILLAFDACFSGSFGIRSKGGPSGPDYEEEPDCAAKVTKALQYKSRLFFCSGSRKDRTPAKSLFASKWLEALRTGGENGIVRSHDLNYFLNKIEEPRCEGGTFSGHDEGGNFVFIRKNTCFKQERYDSPSIDNDVDGIPNSTDRCPDQYGIASKEGCPDFGERSNTDNDTDLDGIANSTDACPNDYGTAKAKGCPDADDDGVPDKSDKCKYTAGEARWEGCPDGDGDGVPDNTDQCPTQKGTIADSGCPPPDRDGDGIPDKSDICPDKYGKANYGGCADTDGDGLPDPDDKCPEVKGETSNEGCPKPDNMILVKGGTFQMGSNDKDAQTDEKPVHPVTLSDYYIGKTEVTVAEFKSFIDANASYQTDADKGDGSYIWTGSTYEKKSGVNWKCDVTGKIRDVSEYNHPVIHISWNDAIAYCQWLSQKTNKTYRLPTEAEWEYAARGGNKSKGYTYAGSNTVEEVAWLNSNSDSKTHAVAGKTANELGLFDLSGNVWEWCNDWNGDYPSTKQTNPAGPDKGVLRVLRGGGWFNFPVNCRAAYRHGSTPTSRNGYLGFRLARSF